MKNVEILNGSDFDEGRARAFIRLAVLGNPNRYPTSVGDDDKHIVDFIKLVNGLHQAILRDSKGVPVAMATVDQQDC